jgi:hypothetical protein
MPKESSNYMSSAEIESYNPWSSAIRFLSPDSHTLPDGGLVFDATGWKVARIKNPLLGEFAGLAYGNYNISSVAVCGKNKLHTAPAISCDCGFYAMKKRDDALALIDGWRPMVLLQVELFGFIYEHRVGWRATEQDVVGISVPYRCAKALCNNITIGMSYKRGFWVTSCNKHLSAEGVDLGRMRSELQMDVTLVKI